MALKTKCGYAGRLQLYWPDVVGRH